MSGGHNLARRIRHHLALADGWVRRDDLQHALGCNSYLLDGTLADLVVDGAVLFNTRSREYRLAVTPLSRRALRMLLQQPDLQRATVGMEDGRGKYRLGLALRVPEAQGGPLIALTEIEMDKPALGDLLALGQMCAAAGGTEA